MSRLTHVKTELRREKYDGPYVTDTHLRIGVDVCSGTSYTHKRIVVRHKIQKFKKAKYNKRSMELGALLDSCS